MDVFEGSRLVQPSNIHFLVVQQGLHTAADSVAAAGLPWLWKVLILQHNQPGEATAVTIQMLQQLWWVLGHLLQ